jgi:hypothetical protein
VALLRLLHVLQPWRWELPMSELPNLRLVELHLPPRVLQQRTLLLIGPATTGNTEATRSF